MVAEANPEEGRRRRRATPLNCTGEFFMRNAVKFKRLALYEKGNWSLPYYSDSSVV